MKTSDAVSALASIAHETRLGIFRLLVQAGPEGVAAGDLGRQLKIPATSMSFHLKELSHARLVKARPLGRHIYYSANFVMMNRLLTYLTENCCGGNTCLSFSPKCSEEKS